MSRCLALNKSSNERCKRPSVFRSLCIWHYKIKYVDKFKLLLFDEKEKL
jgi:hypothetical protein